MVHQNSVAGDDGSHRLLIVPCALVVLVLVLMVTACSTVDGQSGGGGGVAAVADVDGTDDVPDGGESSDGGALAEPEITEDGRMLQPDGHVGIWFETEPTDSLEKLVYESQRYVGQPVMLEPIGDRALMPQWEDMPDPCHPEVMRRMGELGFEVVDSGTLGFGLAMCGVMTSAEGASTGFGLELGFVEDTSVYSGGSGKSSSDEVPYELIETSGDLSGLGCVAILSNVVNGYSAMASMSSFGSFDDCGYSAFAIQIVINGSGGEYVVSI
ncbi:hypothetical protein PQI66_01520 [Corynebacterium sp. USCH3]|uniref:hypothetical protein n=1 Tax=Corynebacterium sp. USCH3 TaxID=3024840 RepID=UPI003097B48C